LRHVGNRADVDNGSSPARAVTAPSYTVVDTSAHWLIDPQWSLSATVENLFDRRYQPTVGYNGRPRGLFVAVSWAPRR
jgi:vitamin B12 transporter